MAHEPREDGLVHGVIVGVRRASDGRYLMIRRGAEVVLPLTIAFPGGGIEPGETDEAAATREAQEELGINVQTLARLWEWDSPTRPLKLIGWSAEWTSGLLAPDPAEVAEAIWMNTQEIVADPDSLAGTAEFARVLDRWHEGRDRGKRGT